MAKRVKSRDAVGTTQKQQRRWPEVANDPADREKSAVLDSQALSNLKEAASALAKNTPSMQPVADVFDMLANVLDVGDGDALESTWTLQSHINSHFEHSAPGESKSALVIRLRRSLDSPRMAEVEKKIEELIELLASADAEVQQRAHTKLSDFFAGTLGVQADVSNVAREAMREIPKWRGRADGKAIDFLRAHYGSRVDMEKRGFFADMLLSEQPKLYRAIATYQSRLGEGLETILPVRTTRSLDGLSEADLAARGQRLIEQRRAANRRYRARQPK